MNIFVTHKDPYKSAKYLDDKRVVKMVLETAQMLNVALVENYNDSCGYKVTHRNHPCTRWVCKSTANYTWLYHHFVGLCEEYTRRYHRVHKCQEHMHKFSQYANDLDTTSVKFVNCTTNHKYIDKVFEAYKLELRHKWLNDVRAPTWNHISIMLIPDAAAYLGLPLKTITRLASTGEIKSLGYGKVDRDSVVHYYNTKRRKAKEKTKPQGLTYKEAAAQLGIKITLLYKHIGAGRIRAHNRRILQEDMPSKSEVIDEGTTIVWNMLKPQLTSASINKRLENIFKDKQ